MGFLVLILSTQDSHRSQEALQKYQAEYSAYPKKVNDQNTAFEGRSKELSDKYYPVFSAQKSLIAAFEAKDVKTVKNETIQDGDGDAISDTSAYAAYYIGFTPDGNIFDQSIDGESLKVPIVVQPGQVIAGWTEGMKGKKIGGIYKLQIPSDKAYGETGSGDKIKPNTPLTFIIMPIEKAQYYKAPEVTPEILKAYSAQQQ